MKSIEKDSGIVHKRCLIVFARRSPWYHLVVKKFTLIYQTHHFFADQIFKDHGSIGIISRVNQLIDAKGIDIVVFDCDFLPYVDCVVIKRISDKVIKVLITFDDLIMHNLNAVNAHACDLVLSADPISVLKYREKGIDSEFMPLEATKAIYKPMGVEKDIDVLFFGSVDKESRKEYLLYLRENGLNVKIVGGPGEYVPLEELVSLINRSKIVINFSRTNPVAHHRKFFRKCDCALDGAFRQFKGRIMEAGFCRTLCVSEYAPSIELLFEQNEVPTFDNEYKCLGLIRGFLKDEKLRDETANRLFKKVTTYYEDTVIMGNLAETINKIRRKSKFSFQSKYYWDYVTKFKLDLVMRNPRILFKEIGFLYHNSISRCLIVQAFRSVLNLPSVLARHMWRKVFSR